MLSLSTQFISQKEKKPLKIILKLRASGHTLARVETKILSANLKTEELQSDSYCEMNHKRHPAGND